MRRLRAFKKKRSAIKKLVLPKPSNIQTTKDVCWDTRAPSSGRSNPDIIITMNKYMWFPQEAKSCRLYDPFFNTGAVKKSYVEVGWQVDNIDHRHENCFECFELRVTQKTLFLTNPPFLEDVLLSFFALLALMDPLSYYCARTPPQTLATNHPYYTRFLYQKCVILWHFQSKKWLRALLGRWRIFFRYVLKFTLLHHVLLELKRFFFQKHPKISYYEF